MKSIFLILAFSLFIVSGSAARIIHVQKINKLDTVSFVFDFNIYKTEFIKELKSYGSDTRTKTQEDRLNYFMESTQDLTVFNFYHQDSNAGLYYSFSSSVLFSMLKAKKAKMSHNRKELKLSKLRRRTHLRNVCSGKTKKRKQAAYKTESFYLPGNKQFEVFTMRIKQINKFSVGCPF
ncbi:MAG: hypothetical protein ACI857_000502 [Arenicella sp.]|jgi:hypothetical protein